MKKELNLNKGKFRLKLENVLPYLQTIFHDKTLHGVRNHECTTGRIARLK